MDRMAPPLQPPADPGLLPGRQGRTPSGLRRTDDDATVGGQLYALVQELYPICRSITGDGVRETLRVVSRVAPIQGMEVPTGTAVLDWEVPPEWNVRDAFIANLAGERLVDFRRHNLHLVSYSHPMRRRVGRDELLRHLHSLPAQPDLIPYRTAYYANTWGFCVPHRLLESLTDPEYDVEIDATFGPGALTYGECVIPGNRPDEVLLSCHICHPSLCNDNLSAVAVAAWLARALADAAPLRYTYRLLFVPGTIGAITWLAQHDDVTARIRYGLVLANLGDRSGFTYKRSRRGDTETDRIVAHVLAHSGFEWQVRDFSPYGYDERQYCSPGFDLPVGRLTRAVHGEFPEYHTSADNLNFVTPQSLADSYGLLVAIVEAIESNRIYLNLAPKGEPQLGRRGVYDAIGGTARGAREMAMLWVLNQSDGGRSLLDIAERARLSIDEVASAAQLLQDHRLLRRCDD